jgi:hypothetical protein
MMNYDNYEWIATRSFVDEDGKHAGIMRLSKPRPVLDVWECVFLFDAGVGVPQPGTAHGVDAFQAIINACAGIRMFLKARPHLSWLQVKSGTGFPAWLPYGLGDEVHDRLETMVNAELMAHVEKLKADLLGSKS